MKKKSFALVGMIIGLVIVLCGILVWAGAFGGHASTAGSVSILYDSGYATFGADFYNFVSNNAADAASAAHTTASNLKSIAGLLKSVCGVFLVGFGLLSCCHFGMAFCACREEELGHADQPFVSGPASEPAPAAFGFTPAPESEPASAEPAPASAPEMPEEPLSD